MFSDSYKVATFNKYLSKNLRRHITSTISDKCVIGSHTEIGANTLIVNSIIGENCKIADNVVIKNSIIWDHVTIKTGSNLDHNLICSHAVIGEDAVLKQGAMIDHRVIVSPKAVLEPNTIGSCLAIMTNEKGHAVFKEVAEPSNGFEKGSVCFLPLEMKLEKYQFIGQVPVGDESDSDLE